MSDLLTRVILVINELITKQEMFTILNISEKVKNDGEGFVNHADVRDSAKPVLDNLIVGRGYISTTIPVAGGNTSAILYHPQGTDAKSYQSTNLRASAPNNAGAPVKTVAPVGAKAASQPSTSGNAVNVKARDDGSVQIPAKVIIDAGLDGKEVVIIKHPHSITIELGSGRLVNLANGFRVSKSVLNECKLGGLVKVSQFTDKLVISRA
jgi:hypothetical protein